MGTQREFNFVLKINKLESEIRKEMDSGVFFKGSKDGLRSYPNEPIIVVDKNWNAFACAKKKMTIEKEDTRETFYTFQLKRYLTPKERETFTNFYQEFYKDSF